tara:strand:+ start:23697 stop:25331 length:1635 start_codon:yes stop_codon:yes gene_type:complete
MSKTDKQPIENAADIIEKFGGIRPMSSKINVAVTTIQGWKKRGVIPATRTALIIQAAQKHGVDLSAFIGGSAAEPVSSNADHNTDATDNDGAQDSADDSADVVTGDIVDDEDDRNDIDAQAQDSKVIVVKKDEFTAVNKTSSKPVNQDYTEIAVNIQHNAVKRSVAIASVIILVVLAAVIGIVKPKYDKIEKREARIAELEGRLSDLKKDQSSFKGLVPENWAEELELLKEQAAHAKQSVNSTVNTVKAISHDLTTESGLNERVTQLQTYVSEIGGESGIYALKGRFDEMRNSLMGEKTLDSSVAALLPIFSSVEGKSETQVNAMIDSARQKNAALQESLNSVPKDELKAAAMLLAMTQVRSALNRGDKDFDGDLVLLKNMVGKDNTQLYNSIDKLAPYSKSGILTPGGLRVEFQTVAGDAVAASLRGEDVSVSEKLSAKFNEILKIEKDDELVTGTETQATLNEAEHLINNDNWQEALNLVRKKLKAKELEPLRPWINEVEKLISSRELDHLIDKAMEQNFGSDLLGGSSHLGKSGGLKESRN